jgi:hypothetical protein
MTTPPPTPTEQPAATTAETPAGHWEEGGYYDWGGNFHEGPPVWRLNAPKRQPEPARFIEDEITTLGSARRTI